MKNKIIFFLSLILLTSSILYSRTPVIWGWVPYYDSGSFTQISNSLYGVVTENDGFPVSTIVTHIGADMYICSNNGHVGLVYSGATNVLKLLQTQNHKVNAGRTNNYKIFATINNNINDVWDWNIAKSAFLNNKSAHIDALVALATNKSILSNGFAGIDIDYEGEMDPDADPSGKAGYIAFIKELANQLHAVGKELAVCSYPDNSYGHPNNTYWSEIADSIDYLNIMAYDSAYEGAGGIDQWYSPPSSHKYSLIKYTAITAGVDIKKINMGIQEMPSWGDTMYGGIGTSMQDHINEINDYAKGVNLAIWQIGISGGDDGYYNNNSDGPAFWDWIYAYRTNMQKNVPDDYVGLTNLNTQTSSVEQGKIQSFNTLFTKGNNVVVKYKVNNDILKDISKSSTKMVVFGLDGTKLYEKKLSAENGVFTGTWDGKDSAGKDVGPGVYIIQLKNNYFAKTTRVIYK